MMLLLKLLLLMMVLLLLLLLAKEREAAFLEILLKLNKVVLPKANRTQELLSK